MGISDRFKRNAGKSPRRPTADADAGAHKNTRKSVRKSAGPRGGPSGGASGVSSGEPAEVSTYVVPTPQTSRRGELLGSAAARVATWSWRFLLILAVLVVLALVVGRLWVVVLPLLLGLLLATVLWPPARLLRRWLPDALASLLVLLGGLLVLFGLGAVLAPQVAGQAQELADAVVAGLNDLRRLVSQPPFNFGTEQVNNVIDQAIDQLQTNAQSIAGGVITGVTTAGSILLNTILALVLCFFFLKDGPKFVPWISALVGQRAAPHVAAVSVRVWDTLSGFIRAQAAVGLVDAVAIGIGLVILDVPLALPLSVLIFFGAFIPIIGAFVTGALAALVALVTQGLVTALIVVALVLLVQQLEGNVLQPLLVGRAVDLHAALVILAVTAGSALAGIVGAFLAVPVVAVGTTIIRYGRRQLDEVVVQPPAAGG